jgi:IS605 OrfB family transposase
MAANRITKVIRLRVLKPANSMSWRELGQMLRDVRYRVSRLANLTVIEAYLNFHLWRTGQSEQFTTAKASQLNRRLRDMLRDEGVKEEVLDRYSKSGALPASVVDALSQYKIKALTSKNKWRDVVRGTAALPTFRANMAIPFRCDKSGYRRLEQTDRGDVELDLMICLAPYPRVVLQTGGLGGGARAILDRLLENTGQSPEGYRQRCFELKEDERTRKWWLYITYDFPAPAPPALSTQRVVGVDLGVACPLYAAINNGHARLGWRHFQALGARIASLQRQVIARRRQVLRGGKSSLAESTARAGHGRRRRLRPIAALDGRIEKAYTTLNHQLSAAVVRFARDHGAGVIQIENLEGLRERLVGTYLGQRWRYHQLQQFLTYKAEEAGIEVRRVDPTYTSRRCSECGYIHLEFDRAHRDAQREPGRRVEFVCPKCEYKADADYNAARNLATIDIEAVIRQQCEAQGIPIRCLASDDEAADLLRLAERQSPPAAEGRPARPEG